MTGPCNMRTSKGPTSIILENGFDVDDADVAESTLIKHGAESRERRHQRMCPPQISHRTRPSGGCGLDLASGVFLAPGGGGHIAGACHCR